MLITRLVNALRRREGHTTAAARSGATVLCISAREAERVRREYGCDAASVHDPEKLRGRIGPKVLDVSALYELERDATMRLRGVRVDRDAARAQAEYLRDQVRRVTEECKSRGRRLLLTLAERDAARATLDEVRQLIDRLMPENNQTTRRKDDE